MELVTRRRFLIHTSGVVGLSTWVDGRAQSAPATAKRPGLPPRVQSVVDSYQSEELRALIQARIGEADEAHYPRSIAAAEFLLDLRNEELSYWLLVNERTQRSALAALGMRRPSFEEARPLARAIMALALTVIQGPITIESDGRGVLGALGVGFGRALNQRFEPPTYGPDDPREVGYRKPELRARLLATIDRALKATKDEPHRLRLQALRLDVKAL